MEIENRKWEHAPRNRNRVFTERLTEQPDTQEMVGGAKLGRRNVIARWEINLTLTLDDNEIETTSIELHDHDMVRQHWTRRRRNKPEQAQVST